MLRACGHRIVYYSPFQCMPKIRLNCSLVQTALISTPFPPKAIAMLLSQKEKSYSMLHINKQESICSINTFIDESEDFLRWLALARLALLSQVRRVSEQDMEPSRFITYLFVYKLRFFGFFFFLKPVSGFCPLVFLLLTL